MPASRLPLNKKPCGCRAFRAVSAARLFLLLRSNSDFDAAIRLQTRNQLLLAQSAAVFVARVFLGLASSFGADGIRRNAFADQVLLDRSGAAFREMLIVHRRADRIGEADGQDLAVVHALQLID